MLQFLTAGRRLGKDQHGRRRSDRVNDSYEGFLRYPLFPHARDGKSAGTDKGERKGEERDLERIAVGIVTENQRVGGAEGGNLRQSEVDKNNLAGDDVNAEVYVIDRKHQAREERNQHPLE